jgi:hypothetical protein
MLPALEVETIGVDPIGTESDVLIEAVEMQALVVEPLDLEPLPRNNP